MIPRAAATALVGLLPAGRGKNVALGRLGHDVHRRARVDPLLLLRVGRLELGDRSHLGAFTVVRNVRTLRLGPHAALGPHNWVSAATLLHGHSDLAGCLTLADHATVSTRHRLDCSGGITLGPGAAIAGWETLVMTHDASVDGSTLTAAPVTIGARSFVHAANKIAAGSTLGHDVRTELGTVVHGAELDAATRYAGNPAVAVGAVPRSLAPAPQPTVVHVLPTVDDAFGGPGPVLAAWLAADDRRGAGVRVFGTVTRPGAVASRLAGLAPVDFAAPGRVLGRFYGNAAQLRRLSAAVAGADLVVSHSFFHVPGLVAAWQAKRSGVPWALAPHGSLDPWDVAAHHARVKHTLAPLWRRVIARAVVWCVTPREAEELVTFGARPPSEVIPCPATVTPTLPVDDALTLLGPLGDRLGAALDAGGRVVSFVGRFDLKKGVARLVEAFDDAAGEHDVLVLAGTGDAEWERRVDDAIDGARRSAQIVRPGWIGPEAKVALWSLPGPFALVSDNENFGVAVAEAMACGRPVLVTDRVALAPMILAGGAGLVTTTAHDEIVRALRRLLRDDALADSLGRQGSALVRDQLSVAAVAGRYREAVSHSLRIVPTPDTLTERIA